MHRAPFALAVTLCAAGAAHADSFADQGIWPDLDAKVRLGPALRQSAGDHARILVDEHHGLVTVFSGEDPVAVYADPLDATTRAELARFAPGAVETKGAPPRDQDRDGDGLVDRLDLLRGAKKLLVNRAAYHERYCSLAYPGGDVPRTEGVCTDTIIRALRNAGIDLQREVHEDMLASPRSYAAAGKVDPNINHRRVKTLLVWFRRHARALPADADYEAGDVIFLDTFPSRPGPEHVGLISDRLAPDGQPLVINNWTDGAVDDEMALLGRIGVTDHFRIDSRIAPRR